MSVKLQYFGIHGRGDVIRAILDHKNVEFTDERLTFEEWGARKASGEFPTLQIPVLEIDGERLNQEAAILHYLGEKYDLEATDARGRYLVNYYLGACEDLHRTFFGKLFLTPSEDEKKATKEDLLKTTLPAYFTDFEKKFLEQKGNQSGFLVNEKLTIADFKVVSILNSFILHEDRKAEFGPVLTKNAPELAKYVAAKTQELSFFGNAEKRPAAIPF